MGVLSNAPAVMLWRRVSNQTTAAQQTTDVMAWPRVGTNDYAIISDAGNFLVGQWSQPAFLKAAAAGCGGGDVSKFDLVSNPGSELLVATRNVNTSVTNIRTAFKMSGSAPINGSASLVDADGNFTALVQTTGVLKGPSATKLGVLLKAPATAAKGAGTTAKVAGTTAKAGAAARAAAPTKAVPTHTAVGYNLLVTNLKASIQFYKNVLGLTAISTSATGATFDLGTLMLNLKPEPAMGLVQSLRKAGRLEGDWLVIHVSDIDAAVKALEGKGVKFPRGIEDSPHGRGANFYDPDGYTFGLWVAPAKPESIDYFPQLQRILQTATWVKAAGR